MITDYSYPNFQDLDDDQKTIYLFDRSLKSDLILNYQYSYEENDDKSINVDYEYSFVFLIQRYSIENNKFNNPVGYVDYFYEYLKNHRFYNQNNWFLSYLGYSFPITLPKLKIPESVTFSYYTASSCYDIQDNLKDNLLKANFYYQTLNCFLAEKNIGQNVLNLDFYYLYPYYFELNYKTYSNDFFENGHIINKENYILPYSLVVNCSEENRQIIENAIPSHLLYKNIDDLQNYGPIVDYSKYRLNLDLIYATFPNNYLPLSETNQSIYFLNSKYHEPGVKRYGNYFKTNNTLELLCQYKNLVNRLVDFKKDWKNVLNYYLNYINTTYGNFLQSDDGIAYMNIEQKIDEIHACLGASEFSYTYNNNSTPTPAYMHLARKIDYIAKVLGISFDLTGKEIVPRPLVKIDEGDNIPGGWYFEQFARNTGDFGQGQPGGFKDEERLGIVYRVRTNQLITDPNGDPKEITQGGYILCESWLQYFEAFINDLDKALDLQNLGTGLMTFNNGTQRKTQVTEGLFDVLQEISIVGADTNQTTEQTRISSLVTQQLVKEVLKGLGLPTVVKKINFRLQNEDVTGQTQGTLAEIPYNGIADQSPTMVSLFMTLLENIAVSNIGKLQLNEDKGFNNSNPTTLDNNIIPIVKNKITSSLKTIQKWFKNDIFLSR